MNKVMHTEKICDFQRDASWWTRKSDLRWERVLRQSWTKIKLWKY